MPFQIAVVTYKNTLPPRFEIRFKPSGIGVLAERNAFPPRASHAHVIAFSP